MNNKLDKLNNLNDLLKAGVISQNEFETLKSEILNNQTSQNATINSENKIPVKNETKEKIFLKSFTDSNRKFVQSPNIQYINFKDLSNEEIQVLKSFIKQKQIHCPAQMTSDEIQLGNKLFSTWEIAEMNSQRQTFNYAFGSIVSILSAGAALLLISLSPCMIYIGGGTFGILSIILSFTVLNKADATKYDRTACYISILLIVIAILVFNYTWWGK
jgi:hypothetical protein